MRVAFYILAFMNLSLGCGYSPDQKVLEEEEIEAESKTNRQYTLDKTRQKFKDITIQRIENANDEFKVSTGTYAGECLQYCKYEYLITSEGILEEISTWESNRDKSEFPSLTNVTLVDSSEYSNLLLSLRAMHLSSGNLQYGCPDCFDQGGEWFEIQSEGIVLRIDCELGQEIPYLAKFIDIIRAIRTKAHKLGFGASISEQFPIQESIISTGIL